MCTPTCIERAATTIRVKRSRRVTITRVWFVIISFLNGRPSSKTSDETRDRFTIRNRRHMSCEKRIVQINRFISSFRRLSNSSHRYTDFEIGEARTGRFGFCNFLNFSSAFSGRYPSEKRETRRLLSDRRVRAGRRSHFVLDERGGKMKITRCVRKAAINHSRPFEIIF